MHKRERVEWVPWLLLLLLLAVFAWGLILNGAYERERARAEELSRRVGSAEDQLLELREMVDRKVAGEAAVRNSADTLHDIDIQSMREAFAREGIYVEN